MGSNKKEVLLETLKGLDIIHRDQFRLKNAGHSKIYCDLKKAYGNPEVLNLIADAVYYYMNKRANCIAGSGHGGIPLASIISSRYDLHLILIRDKEKEHGTQTTVDGYIPTEEDYVALVDDVVSTGNCFKKTGNNLVKVAKTNINECFAVVNRCEKKPAVPFNFLYNLEELL